ncbi:hypothetical protein AB2L27_02780 [Kineococcus sp. LSe6-4]|uniref:Prepilin-type cleavage/methylation domain-containing protein n=1 Tax=Kineococcus halophytocola TaxID=3234027 RepID=A0ABV4GWJ6_9ACTN
MSARSVPDAPVPAPPGPRRAVAVTAGVVTAVALAAAVAFPVVLDGRRSSAAQDLRTDLQRVATAQAAWKDRHGGYSTSLPELGVPAARTDVAIVSAGPDAFCAGAYDDGTRTALFYSSAQGFTATACD